MTEVVTRPGAPSPGPGRPWWARPIVGVVRLLAGRPRPTRQAWVLVVIGGALYAVSRTTGSGWLVVLLAGLAATLVVGFALPLVALRGVDVELRAPTDGTVGQPLRLELVVTGRARDLRITVTWAGAAVAVDAPASGVIQAVPPRRGVVRTLQVQLAAAGPLGLFVSRRQRLAVLERPLEVGPRPLPAELLVPPHAGEADAVDDGCRGDGNAPELVRGARAYVVGDALRLVHWPASARAGSLMVRELEAPGRARLTIVVDLRGPDEEAEAAAGRAAGLAIGALRAGVPVTLATLEADGPVAAPVTDAVAVGRRLARAVAGGPPFPTPGEAGGHVIRVAAS